jgi:hypothetical protein
MAFHFEPIYCRRKRKEIEEVNNGASEFDIVFNINFI